MRVPESVQDAIELTKGGKPGLSVLLALEVAMKAIRQCMPAQTDPKYHYYYELFIEMEKLIAYTEKYLGEA